MTTGKYVNYGSANKKYQWFLLSLVINSETIDLASRLGTNGLYNNAPVPLGVTKALEPLTTIYRLHYTLLYLTPVRNL